MASFAKSLRRKQNVKKKKSLKKGLKSVLKATAGMPTSCTICSAQFTNDSKPDEWFMRIADETITLTCPDCTPTKNS